MNRALIIAAASLALAPVHAAGPFPGKPIRLGAPCPSGVPPDTIARLHGQTVSSNAGLLESGAGID